MIRQLPQHGLLYFRLYYRIRQILIIYDVAIILHCTQHWIIKYKHKKSVPAIDRSHNNDVQAANAFSMIER